MSPSFLTIVIALVVIRVTHWLYRWWKPKCNGQLPPGSMGWPLLGEAPQFFKPTTTSDLISPFVRERMQRYGPIFKTRLLKTPVVVSADPELNHFVFQQEEELFQSWYPGTFEKELGRKCILFLHGSVHKYLKCLAYAQFGSESLKKMLPEVEEAVGRELCRWSSNLDNSSVTVELRDAIASLFLGVAAKKLISQEPVGKSFEDLRHNYFSFSRGYISFPLYIPGTAYYGCLQGRKGVMKILNTMLQERRRRSELAGKQNTDFLDFVVDELTKETTELTEEMALDLIFMLLVASYHTTAVAITLAVKFLTEHPEVLQTLTEEHEGILKRTDKTGCTGLTWQDYKSMTHTHQFITETLRLANIAPSLFRKALKEVRFKGYTIPEGWAVMVCLSPVHLNPAFYEDPLQFKPSRWQGCEMTSWTKNFTAFGGGLKLCTGTEFARFQMAVFLHCLVTKYRWQVVRGGRIVRSPDLHFPDGFHIRLFERNFKESSRSIDE